MTRIRIVGGIILVSLLFFLISAIQPSYVSDLFYFFRIQMFFSVIASIFNPSKALSKSNGIIEWHVSIFLSSQCSSTWWISFYSSHLTRTEWFWCRFCSSFFCSSDSHRFLVIQDLRWCHNEIYYHYWYCFCFYI